jgi:hypothetical protein
MPKSSRKIQKIQINIKNVNLEQPLFGASSLQGTGSKEPDRNWHGSARWKMSFRKGVGNEFGLTNK